MDSIITPSTSQERRLLFIEALLDATDKISKVSSNSVLSGIAEGVSKVAGKAEKDIILAVSELFPDTSFGSQLDRVGKNFGIGQRLSAMGSSTYIRLTGDVGTVYVAGTPVFTSTEGPQFSLEENITIGVSGFAYAKVQSIDTGARSNVAALTINKITPAPSGHLNVINESKAVGGRDQETDEQLRERIKDGGNILARDTLAMIQQVAIIVNNKVLKAYNYGISGLGKRVIALSTQNGAALSSTELTTLKSAIGGFLALTDSQWDGTVHSGLELRNIEYYPVDISFRAIIDGNPDEIRQAVQIAISKYLDFRTFNPFKDKVEWDNLLEIVKSTSGVKYVPDQYFYPRTDIAVGAYKIPRMRGFLMLNMDGTVITNFSGTLSPVFYPNQADFSFISTILQSL